MADTDLQQQIVTLTADIVAAHVSNNHLSIEDVPMLINVVHTSLSSLGRRQEEPVEPLQPAVSVRASVKPDYIICLEDGKKLKMLRRHLRTQYDMTPDEYRAKWNLPKDYPMVAPNYAAHRRALAHKLGLGRKPAEANRKPVAARTRASTKKVK
nr:MucR family transcriptional regulator [Sphingobium sp.]